MKKIRSKTKSDVAFYSIIALMVLITILYGLKIYLSHIDTTSKKIMEESDTSYLATNVENLKNGFKKLNIKSDVEEYLKKKKKITSITYKIKDEKFTFDIGIVTKEDKTYTFNINKIKDDKHEVYARMHLENIEAIEYRTGNMNEATVIKFITDLNSEYFVIIDGNYYFLGSDIKSLSYMNDHFYYMTYNPNYRTLEDVTECTKDVKKSIDGFKSSDYYYHYGKINFLSEYYQKLASKTYTVKEKCDDLASELETKKEEK